MIPIALLLTAVIVGGGIVIAFWRDFHNFILKAIERVKQVVNGIVYGCRVFVKKLQEGVQEISRHYSKVGQHWEETTVTRRVSESEVPPEILERAKASAELDITEEMEMQLNHG